MAGDDVTAHDARIAVWAGLAVAAIVCEAWAVVSRGKFARLGDVVHVASRRGVGQWAMLIGWMWLGWHLFAR